MNPQRPIIVHLVHGTWPFWPFPVFSQRVVRIKAWFEDNSTVQENIKKFAGCPIEFEKFEWSGRNSFREREQASSDLLEYLSDSLSANPGKSHVIVAHSHGGTVAAKALSKMVATPNGMFMGFNRNKSPPTQRIHDNAKIAALICLATPFVYLSMGHLSQGGRPPRNAFSLALGFLISAFFILICLPLLLAKTAALDPSTASIFLNVFIWMITLLTPLVFALAILIWWPSIQKEHFAHFAPLRINPEIPVFLIRATREGAAFAIGLAQIFHATFRAVFTLAQPNNFRLPNIIFSIIATFLFSYIIGHNVISALYYNLLYPTNPHLNLYVIPILRPIVGVGVLGAFYIAGYLILALVVGLTDWHLWADSVIEADAAPPGRGCAFKAYSDLWRFDSPLRHNIYDSVDVQQDIAKIIRAIWEELPPKFEESLSSVDLINMNVAQNQFMDGGDKT